MSELNLIPYSIRDKKDRNQKKRQYFMLGIVGIFFLLFLLFLPEAQFLRVKKQEASYKKQLEALNVEKLNTEYDEIKKEIGSLNQYIEKVDNLTKNKISSCGRIEALESYIPLNVVVDNLVYNDKEMIINGTSTGMQSASEFAANLQMSGNYKDVRITNVNLNNQDEKAEIYKFTIKCVY